MKWMWLFSDIEGRRLNAFMDEPMSSLNLGGNSLGRTYDTLYPLTRICPVYLSSSVCTLTAFVEDVRRLECAVESAGVVRAKSERYDFEERAGRLSDRAALWRRGDVVDEKLYGIELLSIGCTWEVNILTFSSGKVFSTSTEPRTPKKTIHLEIVVLWIQQSHYPLVATSDGDKSN